MKPEEYEKLDPFLKELLSELRKLRVAVEEIVQPLKDIAEVGK